MRNILIMILLMVFPTLVFADFYIVDSDNNIIGKVQYQPDQKDLDTRKEIAVYSKDDIQLGNAEYRNGKIVKHVKTAKESKVSDELDKKQGERDLVRHKMMKMAYEQMKAEGFVFKYVMDEDFK